MIVLILGLFVSPSMAVNETFHFQTPAAEQQFNDLLKEFRCVTCPNQSIGDSGASVARAMQEEIYSRLQQGESEEEIRIFLLSRYGDYVTYKPPLKMQTWVLWLGPFVLLILGAGIWRRMCSGL
jgi:cytochrome c-type biogenesis protein CcmH